MSRRGGGRSESWEDAAVDALVNCPPRAARNKDWSDWRTLTKLEQYNGLGYAARGRPSPYIWSGTDQYKSGKYVRDGVYDPNVVDSQPGCAGLLMAMMALDPTITFTGATIAPPTPVTPIPAEKPCRAIHRQSGQGLDRRVHRQHLQRSLQEEIMITWWDRIKASFKDSMTILWARIQYVVGIVGGWTCRGILRIRLHATDEHGRQRRIQDAAARLPAWPAALTEIFLADACSASARRGTLLKCG